MKLLFCIVFSVISIPILAEKSVASRALEYVFGEKELTIEEIVDETQEIKDDVKGLSKEYVIDNVKKYNSMTSEMRSEVNSKDWFLFEKEDSEKFEIILDGIGEISDFYNDLAERRDAVKKKLKSYINDIQNFEDTIDNKVANEELINNNLLLDLEKLNINVSNSKRHKIKKLNLSKRLEFSRRRIEMLVSFKENYSKLLPVMSSANQSIDDFIFVVIQSSSVYDDAYKTLKLQKDINDAYRTLDDLNSLDYLSNDIVKSWSDLESIVDTLSQQSIVLQDIN